MSQFSEMMGSFIRTGNYPLEAHYIFDTQEDLINFYDDPINRTTMHVGLFRIVRGETKDDQSLYWVVPNDDGYLYFEKLADFRTIKDIDSLKDLIQQEIEDRKTADNAIWGTVDTTVIDSDLNSILKLSSAVLDLRYDLGQESDKSDSIKKELKDDIKAIVGTEDDNIINYLQTLDYKNLTEISELLNKFFNTIDDEDESINTLPELKEFLKGFTYTKKLYECFVDLWTNIQGIPTPNTQFRTLRGIQDFVEALASASKNRMDNLQTELDQTQVGVGLSGDGAYNADQETYYLKNATSVMNALKVLDSLINQAINNCNMQPKETNTVDITINKEADKTTISATVKLSSEVGNDIQIKNDGIYHNIDSEYENGILTIKVNGNIRQQHVLGLSSVVGQAYYDPTQEAIVIVFKLHDGQSQTVLIPAAALIAEWEVDNANANKVVELTKERVISGADKLSADVRLSTDKHNILEKDGNTLLVRGVADNIIYDGDTTVKTKLDSLTETNSTINSTLSDVQTKLTDEINRAEIAEQGLSNDITNLRTDVETKDQDLLNKIDLEKVRAESAEANLDSKIETVKSNIENNISTKISSLQDALNNEITRSTTEDATLRDQLIETNTNLNTEIQRATNAEALLTKNVADLQKSLEDNFTDDTQLREDVENLKLADISIRNSISLETERATNAEKALDHRIDDIKDIAEGNQELITTNATDIADIKVKNSEQDSAIKALDDKIAVVKDNVETNIGNKISTLQDALNQEISRSTQEDADTRTKLSELSTAIANEVTRAEAEESVIRTEINQEKERATQREDFIDSRITDHINDHNNPHQVTADQINVYTKDKINSLLENINNNHGTITNDLKDQIVQLKQDFGDHIVDYGNPHKVTKAQIGLDKVDNTTDLEKPISVATQEALHNLDLKISNKAEGNDLLEHIFDHDNPHLVTKDQIGLNNVDNTTDLDKPISLATQMALDKKSDIGHTHTMTDITDLENLPIVKGFINLVSDLPETAVGGDKYILTTKVGSGATRYTLCEYDGSNGTWKQKLLTTGGIASVIDKDVHKLNSSGIERILDVSDYDYFYNKIYDETKDLIEDIDWEEDDENADTNNQIRLKITYKTSYGDPNEDEVTNPYKKKAVKYIDIDKARFLADAYSRPARQSDVDEGYASKVGEPVLVLVMTTGDYVTISLKDALNIYDPIDTASIDMEVTDWTGDPDTAYKVSATIRLASTEDKKSAVSLHVKDDTEKGMYANLHTSNTNSISLNPATGANGSQKSLTANLNIDNQINNNSDVLLTVGTSGLSAKLIWGEYE